MRRFDVEQFLYDYGISYTTSEKNVSQGWIGVQCPFCYDHSNHGGFNINEGYYTCWRCDWHPLQEVIIALTGVGSREAKWLIRVYSESPLSSGTENRSKGKHRGASETKLPINCGPLEARHRSYLESRNFDPDELEREYDLKGTGPIGPYKFRIIAPIYLDGEMVSYHGRDITGKSPLRYKACAKADEVVHHKHTLYNIDRAKGRSVIVVEGITDVWRLGAWAVATFGVAHTRRQLLMLARRFTNVFVLFDEEAQAQEKAESLGEELSALGLECEVISIEGDPADLSESDAQALKRELLVRLHD